MANYNQSMDKSFSWKVDVISKEELIDLYYNKNYGVESIAKIKKCSSPTIKKRLAYYGIKEKTFIEACSDSRKRQDYHIDNLDPNSKKGNRKIYLKIDKDNFEWKCIKCNHIPKEDEMDLVVHHIDSNNRNNSIENLMILCQSCHNKIHRFGGNKRWLEQ